MIYRADVKVSIVMEYDGPPEEDGVASKIEDGDVKWFQEHLHEILNLASDIGFPVFMRTDLFSGKHYWRDTCFCPSRDRLIRNMPMLLDIHGAALWMNPDSEARALVLREFIPLVSSFAAFEGMPVAQERRYFIRDGEVEAHYPYWPEEAIIDPSRQDWREALQVLNEESEHEVAWLTDLATRVAEALPGYWSVDFAHHQDGRWFLIDMAEGEKSWRPDGGAQDEVRG